MNEIVAETLAVVSMIIHCHLQRPVLQSAFCVDCSETCLQTAGLVWLLPLLPPKLLGATWLSAVLLSGVAGRALTVCCVLLALMRSNLYCASYAKRHLVKRKP